MDSETLAAIWSQCDRLQQKPTIKPIDSRLCKECSIYKTLTREGRNGVYVMWNSRLNLRRRFRGMDEWSYRRRTRIRSFEMCRTRV